MKSRKIIKANAKWHTKNDWSRLTQWRKQTIAQKSSHIWRVPIIPIYKLVSLISYGKCHQHVTHRMHVFLHHSGFFLCRWLSSGLMNIFVGLFTTNWVKIIMLCGWRTVDPILVMWLRMSKSREYFQRICNTVQETHNNKSKMNFSPPFVCTMLYSDSILYAIFAFVVCISFSLSPFEWIFHFSSSLPNWIGIILLFHLFPLALKRCGTNIHLHHNTYVHSELRDTFWWKATTDLFLPGKRENKGE